MPAAVPVRELSLTRQSFTDAISQVNEWRGRCLDAFTRAETAVTECLAVMAAVNGRGSKVTLPHLVGQRLEELAMMIAAAGPFESEGSRAAVSLTHVQEQLNLRTILCHGTARITLDVSGRWTVVLRLATFRSRLVHHETMALNQTEADAARIRLVRASHSLCSFLGQVSAALVS